MKIISIMLLLSVLSTEPAKLSSIKKAVEKLELGTNESFKNLMNTNKHKTHFLLPQHLLSFIDSFPPFRFSYSNAVDFQDGKLRLTWFFSEFALEGNEEDNRKKIKTFMEKDGFTEKEAEGDFSMKYIKPGTKFSTDFMFLDLVNFTGGKGAKCGGTLVYSIELSASIKPATINEALETLPSLKFETFPKTVYAFISGEQFSSINYGGTWQRYYTWSVSIPFANKEKMKTELQTIRKLLEKDGYEVDDEKENEITYRSTDHIGGSWFYITVENSNLELRFQPNS
jgi:hypothetical protein